MTSDSSGGRTPDELVSQVRFLEAEVLDRLRSVAGLQVSRFDIRVKPA